MVGEFVLAKGGDTGGFVDIDQKINAEVDKDIVDKVLTIQNLPEDERNRILFTIDALVRDAKSRFAYAS
ncbi:MAG: hypothetical protein ACI86M_002891 [Saprospiraceae bacterium]|jgi:hypothetical protein